MLLSRSADQLYWMSRYLERAEHTSRLIDVQLNLQLEELDPNEKALRWARVFTSLNTPPCTETSDYDVINNLAFDTTNVNSLVSCISAARENARNVREMISTEMWGHLNRLYLMMKEMKLEDIWHDQPHAFFVEVRSAIQAFQGITDGTMVQGEGYQFIQVGRYVERAMSISQLLSVHYNKLAENEEGGNNLEWIGILKGCTAFEAYCKVYTADLRPQYIAEFLLLNPYFPHSIRFAIAKIQLAIDEIAASSGSGQVNGSGIKRLAGRLRARVDYGHVSEIIHEGLDEYLNDLRTECIHIHDLLYKTFINYPIEYDLTAQF